MKFLLLFANVWGWQEKQKIKWKHQINNGIANANILTYLCSVCNQITINYLFLEPCCQIHYMCFK
jgi:hypothetical protein